MLRFIPEVNYEGEGTGGVLPVVDPPVVVADTPPPVTPPTPPPVGEAPPARPWYEKRIDQLTATKRDSERQIADMQRQLIQLQTQMKLNGVVQSAAGQPVNGNAGAVPQNMTQTQLDDLVEQRALEKAGDLASQTMFTRKCNEVYQDAKAKFPDFDQNYARLNSVMGGISPEFLQNVVELDNPAQVLYDLGRDPETATRIAGLNPIGQVRELVKMSLKPGAPRLSGAPPIITPPVSGGLTGEISSATENLPIDKWMELRNKEVAARRKQLA